MTSDSMRLPLWRAVPRVVRHLITRGLAAALLSLALGCASPPPATIGAILGRKSDGRVFLRDVPPHLAADEAGLRPGDQLLLIEGRDVRSFTDEGLRQALEGEPGSEVRVTVIRGEEVLRVTLKRTPAKAYRLH